MKKNCRAFCFVFVLSGHAVKPMAFDLSTSPAPGQWLELPNTKIRSVLPSPVPGGNTGPTSIIIAWNGAALDSKRSRLIIWGGGHGDYYGNEIYALDLAAEKIQRLTDPSPAVPNCQESMAGGLPTSRHTYYGLSYVPETDEFMSMGGALAPCGNGSSRMWLFNFATSRWRLMSPSGSNPDWDGNGQLCAYDPVTKKVYFDDEVTLSVYTPSTNTWARVGTHAYIDYHLSAAIDSKRRKMVTLGDGVRSIDLATGTMTTLSTTNAPALASNGQSPGIAYDPVADRIVAWHGGNTIYALNMDTRQWATISPGTGPGQPAPSQGTYGRFAYVPQYGVFAMVNSIDQNGWVFRLSALSTTVEGGHRPSASPDISASPNPFRATAEIRVNGYSGAGASLIKVCNLRGREVADLSKNFSARGETSWTPQGLPSGLYLVKIRAGNRWISRPLFYQK